MSFMSFSDSEASQVTGVQAPMQALASVCPHLLVPVWAWAPWAWALWGASWSGRSGAAVAPTLLPPVVSVASSPTPATAAPDKLARIEGIGPQIARVLNQAGITTFAGLSTTSVDRLESLLAAAGPRFKLARPQTWPEQAALLAAGNEIGFAALTAELKGGVRV